MQERVWAVMDWSKARESMGCNGLVKGKRKRVWAVMDWSKARESVGCNGLVKGKREYGL